MSSVGFCAVDLLIIKYQGLFTLRIWAIYELDYRVLISVGLLSLSLFVVNVLALLGFIPFVRVDRVGENLHIQTAQGTS